MKISIDIIPAKPKNSFSKLFKRHLLLVIVLLSGFMTTSAQVNNEFTSDSFKVYGECGQCKTRIEKALKIKGIRSAVWDVNTKMLSVNYDPAVIKPEEMHSRVAAAGHDTELKKAKDEVYNALPECCSLQKYGRRRS